MKYYFSEYGTTLRVFRDSIGGIVILLHLRRLMIRLYPSRWLKLAKRRSYFYKANAIEFGPFTLYWRDKRP